MNKRLHELAIMAGISHLESRVPDMCDLYKCADFELAKFAKLIVAECAYTARQCYVVRGVDAEDVARHIEESTFK